MKRRVVLLAAGSLGLAMLSLAGLWWLTVHPHRITEENIGKIERGQTEAEIEMLLGAPPGYYAPKPSLPLYDNFSDLDQTKAWKAWVGDDACVRVLFDEQGRATETRTGHVFQSPKTPFQKLRRWLRL